MHNVPPDKAARIADTSGFTLIEMSIVLVIIGLLVGGILTGQDLINAAAQQTQVTQIQKYNTAVNTFRGKYGNLPGDIPDPIASQFGFQARGVYAGEGDGNGIIEGVHTNAANISRGWRLLTGETSMFWRDLSDANLVDGGFSSASPNTIPGSNITLTSTPNLNAYYPTAKLGNGNYIYVYSGGEQDCFNNVQDGINYFGIQAFTGMLPTGTPLTANISMTVLQAYNIDAKVDDGLPQSGNVMALYFNNGIRSTSTVWAAGGGVEGANNGVGLPPGATTTATPPLTTDCYGNNNTAGIMQYSVSTNTNIQNCALSFKFQ